MSNETKTSETLKAAFEYRALGWSPIALCTPDHKGVCKEHARVCEKPGKVPFKLVWKEWQERIATLDELRAEWAGNNKANVGIVLGSISGMVGIDVDGIMGEEWLLDLAGGEITPTMTFNTGKDDSYRLLYRIPRGHDCPTIPFRNKDHIEALKILGDGSQTVAPPSMHINGYVYKWVPGRGPGEIALTDAPPWLLAMLNNKGQRTRESQGGPSGSNPQDQVADGAAIKQKGRNSTLAAIAGAARRFGCTQGELFALLEAVNQRCDPPLADTELHTIARSIARYRPTMVPTTRELLSQAQEPLAACLEITMDRVKAKHLKWIWPGWLPLGVLICIDGDGGIGKTTMMTDLASRVTRGDIFPDGSSPNGFQGPQNVLMIGNEDLLEEIIKPRCKAAGADEKRVHYLEEVLDKGCAEPRGIEFPRDWRTLEAYISRHKIKFVFIDPILAFLDEKTDYNKDANVRKVLSPLKKIAQQHQCTICYLRHLNKGSVGSKAAYRGGGSQAFVNAARIALYAGKHPDNEAQTVLALSKGNYARRTTSWVFETQGVPGWDGVTTIKWVGTSTLTADDVNHANANYDPDAKTMTEEAEEFLEDFLGRGPKSKADILKEAGRQKLTPKVIRRAREHLNVKTIKPYGANNSQSVWSLPPKPQPAKLHENLQANPADQDAPEPLTEPQDDD